MRAALAPFFLAASMYAAEPTYEPMREGQRIIEDPPRGSREYWPDLRSTRYARFNVAFLDTFVERFDLEHHFDLARKDKNLARNPKVALAEQSLGRCILADGQRVSKAA